MARREEQGNQPSGRWGGINWILWILWVLCISFTEVALIIWGARTLGAIITFCLVVVPTIVGLLIQTARWYLLKPVREEAKRLLDEANAKHDADRDRQKYMESPEMEA